MRGIERVGEIRDRESKRGRWLILMESGDEFLVVRETIEKIKRRFLPVILFFKHLGNLCLICKSNFNSTSL